MPGGETHKIAVYMTNGEGPDEAIVKGLQGAGCQVTRTRSIAETLDAVRCKTEERAPLLVAEIQAGAMPLLAILRERGNNLPPTLLLDRAGTDIYAPIKALEFGVRAYVLSSQPPIERELMAQLTAERALNMEPAGLAVPPAPPQPAEADEASSLADLGSDFDWDDVAHVIRVEGKYIHLSPIEGRIFDMLLRNRGRTVTLRDFMEHALRDPGIDEKTALEQLRPHIMRLRRKLAGYPTLAERIINTRGSGYMMI